MTDKEKSITTILDKSEYFSIGPKTGYVDLTNGKRMKIRELSSDQRVQFSMDNAGPDGRIKITEKSKTSMIYLIIWGAITESGDPIFTKDDLEALRAGSGSVLDTVAQAILVLSGMKAEQIESAAKN
jgi:hypothetical protein